MVASVIENAKTIACGIVFCLFGHCLTPEEIGWDCSTVLGTYHSNSK